MSISSVLLWGLGIVIFLIVLSISIGLHEAGHMFTARRLGMKVPRFFIGFGPTLWSFKRGEEEDEREYGVKAIPLGGFVQIYDPEVEDEDNPEREMLSHVKPWKRLLVFAAGPAVNIVIGISLLILLPMVFSSYVPSTTVRTVNECEETSVCGASKGGLIAGDVLQNIDGNKIDNHYQISSSIKGRDEVEVVVLRDGEEKTLTVPIIGELLGVNVKMEERKQSFNESWNGVKEYLLLNLEAIASLPSQIKPTVEVIGGAERGDDSLGSIITVGKAYGDISSTDKIPTASKFQTILLWTALVNLSLGLINLIPFFTVLDGGRMTIAVIDSLRLQYSRINKKWKYTPLPMKYITPMMLASAAALFGLMGLMILADIVSPVSVI